MKKIFLITCMLIALSAQTTKAGDTATMAGVPSSLLTDDSTWWTTSTLSALGYVSASTSSGYYDHKDAGGRLAKFRFGKDNRFHFILYEQANSYGTETETWIEVEGTVEFTKDEKGQDVFITKAEKGTSRVLKNGRVTKRAIHATELTKTHSNTYLWERISFPGNPSRVCLLVVDLDEHPQASCKTPGSIDRSWVTAYHIPAKTKTL
jgi:hypothetical protein